MTKTSYTYIARVNDYYALVTIYDQGVERERYTVMHEDGDWRDGVKGMQGTTHRS